MVEVTQYPCQSSEVDTLPALHSAFDTNGIRGR